MTYGNTPSFNAETECKRLWVVMGDCAAQQTELIVDVMKIASRMEQLEEEIKTVCVLVVKL